MTLDEMFMSSADQLRDGQAVATLQYLISHDEETTRGKELRHENILDIPTYSDVKLKCEALVKARLKKNNEMEDHLASLRAGEAPATSVVVQSSSRFASAAMAPVSAAITEVIVEKSVAASKAMARKSFGRGRGRGSQNAGRGSSGASSAVKSGSPLFASGFVSPAGKKKSAVPLLSQSAAAPPPSASPGRRLVAPGGVVPKRGFGGRDYVRKSIDLQEIFNGAVPTRQTNPVSICRADS